MALTFDESLGENRSRKVHGIITQLSQITENIHENHESHGNAIERDDAL